MGPACEAGPTSAFLGKQDKVSEELRELIAGVVGSPRGLKGEVFVNVHTDRPEEVFKTGSELRTENPAWPLLTVASAVPSGPRLLVRFEDVDSREDAEAIRGLELLVPAEEEDNAWYPHQLAGLEAVDEDGLKLGSVTGLMAAPAHDLLVVRSGGQDVLVPFVTQMVPVVDLEAGRVVLDPPEGLFPSELGEEPQE